MALKILFCPNSFFNSSNISSFAYIPLPDKGFLINKNPVYISTCQEIIHFALYLYFKLFCYHLLSKNQTLLEIWLFSWHLSFLCLKFSMFFFISDYFFWIPVSAADAAAINPSGIKTLLANGLCTLFIKSKPTFVNILWSLPT